MTALVKALKNPSDINVLNGDKETALHWAVHWNSAVVVSYLLSVPGINVHQLDIHGNNCMHKISESCHTDDTCQEIVVLLVRTGIDVTARNEFGRTPLAHFDSSHAKTTLSGDAQAQGVQTTSGEVEDEEDVDPNFEKLERLAEQFDKEHNEEL